MDPSSISELLPLGGAGVLLIYLLRILIAERRYWVTERNNLNAEIERMKRDHQKALRDIDLYWQKKFENAQNDFWDRRLHDRPGQPKEKE